MWKRTNPVEIYALLTLPLVFAFITSIVLVPAATRASLAPQGGVLSWQAAVSVADFYGLAGDMAFAKSNIWRGAGYARRVDAAKSRRQ